MNPKLSGLREFSNTITTNLGVVGTGRSLKNMGRVRPMTLEFHLKITKW
jgi:hypothetical protein